MIGFEDFRSRVLPIYSLNTHPSGTTHFLFLYLVIRARDHWTRIQGVLTSDRLELASREGRKAEEGQNLRTLKNFGRAGQRG